MVPAIRRDPQTLLKLLVLSPVVSQAEESPSEPLFYQFLGQEDLLEKGEATHSNILGLPLWLSW